MFGLKLESLKSYESHAVPCLFNDVTLVDEWLNSKDLVITSHFDFVDGIWHVAIDVNYYSLADFSCEPGSKL